MPQEAEQFLKLLFVRERIHRILGDILPMLNDVAGHGKLFSIAKPGKSAGDNGIFLHRSISLRSFVIFGAKRLKERMKDVGDSLFAEGKQFVIYFF